MKQRFHTKRTLTVGAKWKLEPEKVGDLPKLVQEEMTKVSPNSHFPTPNHTLAPSLSCIPSRSESLSQAYWPGTMAGMGRLTENATPVAVEARRGQRCNWEELGRNGEQEGMASEFPSRQEIIAVGAHGDQDLPPTKRGGLGIAKGQRKQRTRSSVVSQSTGDPDPMAKLLASVQSILLLEVRASIPNDAYSFSALLPPPEILFLSSHHVS